MNNSYKKIIKHYKKIVITCALLPLIIRYHAIILYPAIKLIEVLPSHKEVYDNIASLRTPFLKRGLSEDDILNKNIIKLYNDTKYSEHDLVNLEFIFRELLKIQETANNEFSKEIDVAIKDLRLEKFNTTILIFKKLIKYGNDKETYLGFLALATFFTEQDKAILYFNEALNINPNNLFLLNNLGKSYLAMNQFAKAKKTFNKIMTLGNKGQKPELIALANSNLGIIELKAEKLPKALLYFNHALEIAKSSNLKLIQANQYKNIAITYKKLNNSKKSCANYRKARILYHKLYLDFKAEDILTHLKKEQCL